MYDVLNFTLKTLVWIRIQIGSGFSKSLNAEPDLAKCLDPDSDSPAVLFVSSVGTIAGYLQYRAKNIKGTGTVKLDRPPVW
jgi:hypothetical protein